VRQKHLTIPERFQILQPYFAAIRVAELQDYFTYLTSSLLDRVQDANVIIKCMAFFDGCEVLENERELAWLFFDSLQWLVDDTNILLEKIFIYIENESQSWKNVPGSWSQRNFRQWILFYFTDHVLEEFGVRRSFEFFQENGWYSRRRPGILRPIWLEMEREANLSFGTRYRWEENREIFDDSDQSTKEPQELRTIISRLIDGGKKRDRELAFHIIRHTKPVTEVDNVIVDKSLRPYLQTIYEDRQLKALKHKFKKFLDDNLMDPKKANN
jgi:hypothetical protein